MSGYRKLGKRSDQRKAMLRAMVTYLLENGQIKTTYARAKDCVMWELMWVPILQLLRF